MKNRMAFLITAAAALSCKSVNTSKAASSSSNLRWLNEWEPDAERTWYTTPQGSHLIPWEIFNALEAPQSSALFSSRRNMDQYGFSYANSDSQSLPMGFMRDTSILDNKDYLGFNCAACHTGRVVYNNKSYFIHGGPATSELDRFITDLSAALHSLDDSGKYKRFQSRMRGANADLTDDSIKSNLAGATAWVDETKKNLVTTYPAGPGRLDAVSWIINTVTATEPGIPSNWYQPTVPIAYPHLWKAPDLECVQTDCQVSDPIPRNVGEVLGVFGHINLKGNPWILPSIETASSFLLSGDLFKSTVKISNLYELEESLRVLKAPRWPKEFPAIDSALAASGQAIYQSNCAQCHVSIRDGITSDVLTDSAITGRSLIKVTKVPFREVGTDSTYMVDHGAKMAKPGVLGPILALSFASQKNSAGEYPSLKMLGIATVMTSEKYFRSKEFKDLAQEKYLGDNAGEAAKKLKEDFHNYREAEKGYDGTSYKARPLDGIAFTAPYFHNGSVPTLSDVLEVPANRPNQFRMGDYQFDAEKVGLKSSGAFVYDTRVRGNGNGGHMYGTDLDAQSKRALLEYLKTL